MGVLLIISMILVSMICNFFSTTWSHPSCQPPIAANPIPVYEGDVDPLQFALNLEHLEADFFLWGALGYGLDHVAPQLVMGGPLPIGAQKAHLDFLTKNIITEFA